jgi:hypothetical protein
VSNSLIWSLTCWGTARPDSGGLFAQDPSKLRAVRDDGRAELAVGEATDWIPAPPVVGIGECRLYVQVSYGGPYPCSYISRCRLRKSSPHDAGLQELPSLGLHGWVARHPSVRE